VKSGVLSISTEQQRDPKQSRVFSRSRRGSRGVVIERRKEERRRGVKEVVRVGGVAGWQ
jgi:hypothetical protein